MVVSKGIKQRTRLTAREKGYIRSIAEGKTRRQAIRDNYNVKPDGSVKTLDKMADLIEKRPLVLEVLQRNEREAQETITDVMQYSRRYGATRDRDGAQYARVAIDGANSILDRLHGKARQQVDVQATSLSINIDLSSDDE